jgi:hypothetical protein
MRSTHKRLFAVLVAMLALSAIAVTSASAALPEISPNPTEKVPLTFTVKLGGEHEHSVTFQGLSGLPVICRKGATGTGKFTGAKTGVLTQLTFTECALNGSEEYECSTLNGAVRGELRAKANLPIELVYKSKAAHEVGILINHYEPKLVRHNIIPEYRCPAGLAAGPIWGETIWGPVQPLNKFTKTLAFNLHSEKGAAQKFENGLGEAEAAELFWYESAAKEEKTGLTAETTITLEKETKILG